MFLGRQNELIHVDGSIIKGIQPGIGLVQALSDQVSKKYQVEVVGRDQVKAIDLGIPYLLLNPGDTTSLKIVSTKSEGKAEMSLQNCLIGNGLESPGQMMRVVR